jgi:hypothetical protein
MQVDVRGPRFAAGITTVVLIAILVTGNGWLSLAQTVVFALGTFGPRFSPYSAVYRTLVAPRLPKPTEFEPVEPLRFAQGTGLVFTAVGTLGYLGGVPIVGLAATAGALAAAFLNAAFGLCLGCETYLLLRRTFGPRTAS